MRILSACLGAALLASPAFAVEGIDEEIDYQALYEEEANQYVEALGLNYKGEQPEGHHHPRACRGLDVSEAQKVAIRTAVFDAKREKMRLRTEIKITDVDYREMLLNAGDAAAAREIDVRFSGYVGDFGRIKSGLRTQIIFDIFAEEQRLKAYRCLKAIKKKKIKKKLKKLCRKHGEHRPHPHPVPPQPTEPEPREPEPREPEPREPEPREPEPTE